MDSVTIFRKLYEKPLIISSLIVAAVTTSLYVLLTFLKLPGFIAAPISILVQLLLPLSVFALLAALLLKLTDYIPGETASAKRFGITPLPHYEPLARTRMPKQLKALLLVNRATEVEEANSFIQSPAKLLLISGERGIGKSTLAALIARRVDFWLNLEGKDVDLPYLAHQLAQWKGLEELKTKTTGLEKISKYEINALVDVINEDKSRVFFNSFGTLLDDKGNYKNKEIELLFNSLLLSEGQGKLIIISSVVPACLQEYLQEEGSSIIDLQGLSVESGSALLEKQYSSEDGESWFNEISAAVEGNPLLLRIVPPVLSDDDSTETIRSSAWRNSQDPSSLNISFLENAAGEGLSLLQKIAFIPEPVTESFLLALADDLSGGSALLKDLKQKALLEWDGGMKKYYLHPLITSSAFNSLKQNKKHFEEIRQHVIGVCIKKAEDFKPPAKWTSVSDCRLYLHAIDLMLENSSLHESMDLLVRIHQYMLKWGNLRLLSNFYMRLIDLWKQNNVKLSEEEQNLLNQVLMNLVDTELAGRGQKSAIYSAHALYVLSSARKSIQGRISSASLLSKLYLEEGNLQEATKYCDNYLKAAEESGDKTALAVAMGFAGLLYKKASEFKQSETSYNQAIALFREQEDSKGEAKALGNLAELYSLYGFQEEALELFQSKINLVTATGDEDGRLRSMYSMGKVHMAAGKSEQALAIWDGVASEAVEKEYWKIAAGCLKSLAGFSMKQGDFAASILRGQKRLEIAAKISDKEIEASALANMGIAYAKSREFDKSMESYLKARDLFLGLNMVGKASRCYYYISRLHGVAEEWDIASVAIVETINLSIESGKGLNPDLLRLMSLCRVRYGVEAFDQQAAGVLGDSVYNVILESISG